MAAGQADLTAVGVAAEHGPEAGVGGMPVDLRGVGQQQGAGVRRYPGDRLVDVVDLVIVGVVDPDQVQQGPVPLYSHRLVEQYPDAHVLEPGDQADAVVIAEHGIDRTLQLGADDAHARQGRADRAIGLGPVVPGEHAQVIVQPLHPFCDGLGDARVQVRVQVAEMQDPQPLEGSGQPGQG